MTTLLTRDATSARRMHVGAPVALPLHDGLWRITRPDGDVLGYIERFSTAEGARFRVKRLLARKRRLLAEGEFWAMDDALECFRTG